MQPGAGQRVPESQFSPESRFYEGGQLKIKSQDQDGENEGEPRGTYAVAAEEVIDAGGWHGHVRVG